MLDKLINLVREEAGDLINNNPNIAEEKKESAIAICANTILNVLKKAFAAGNLGSLTELLKNPNNVLSNHIVMSIVSQLAENYSSELSLPTEQSQILSNSIIEKVVSALIKKVNDPNDHTFDTVSVIKELSGGGLGSLLGAFFKK